MEQSKTRLLLPIALLILALSGCKKPLEQPELVDPIHTELVGAASAIESGMKTEGESVQALKEDLKKSDITTGEKRQLLKQISAGEKKLQLMDQDLLFYRLRAKSRVQYVREIYPARFEKGLPWPDPDEIAQFEANKRLRGASRNWSDHIPKLNYGPDKSANKAEKAGAAPSNH